MGLLDLIGHTYPFTDFHELNLDWCITAILQLQKAFEDFSAGNKLTFADPLQHDITKTYAKNTIVIGTNGNAYLSLHPVPVGVPLINTDYWLIVFDFEDYTEKANKNFTDNYFSNTERAPYALAVDAWIVLDDVLYKVTQAIAFDELFIIDTNIVHFTIEQFLKDFVTSVNTTLTNWYNQMTGTINQYKNDIDASELAYRQQLAQDIATTTASLQAQLDLAISGATVDSEVINARLGADGTTYSTLGDAVRTQIAHLMTQIYPLTPQAGMVQGSVSTVLGTSIANAAIVNNGNMRLRYPLYVGDVKSITITPAAGYEYAARAFDADGKLCATFAKSTAAYTIQTRDNNYYFIWIFGSYENQGTPLTSDDEPKIENGFTISYEKLEESEIVVPRNTQAFTWIDNYYYRMLDTDNIVDFPPAFSSATYRCAAIAVKEGDIAVINCAGGLGSRAYGFLDKNQHIIEAAPANTTLNNTTLIAPANAAYLVLNDSQKDKNSFIYTSNICKDKLDNIYSKLSEADLRNSIDGFVSAVDTYKTQIDALITKVHADIDDDCISFALITDVHYSPTFNAKDELDIFNYVTKNMKIDFCANLGDIADESYTYEKDFWKIQANTGVPLVFCKGNHDPHMNLNMFASDHCRVGLDSFGQTAEQNFYFDIGDTRVLAFDSSNGISDDTLTWLDKMLNDPSRKIIMLTHKPVWAGMNWGQDAINNAAEARQLVYNFNVANGIILGYFFGHTHVDNMWQYNTTPVINTACGLDVQVNNDQGYFPTSGSPSAPARTPGTITEFLFDVVVIHKTTRTINLFRFGAGNDRSFTPS